MPLDIEKYSDLDYYINHTPHGDSCPFCGADVDLDDKEEKAFQWNQKLEGYLLRVWCQDTEECGGEWYDLFKVAAVKHDDLVVYKKLPD